MTIIMIHHVGKTNIEAREDMAIASVRIIEI
jgi:hypothetical protein